jgi:hypothetical protein
MTQKVTTKLFILSLLLLLAAVPVAALAQEMLPTVTVEDQEIVDNKVTIAKVVSEGPGWLVIHLHENDNIGPVIGQSPVVDGENTNVVVEIDPTLATETLYAMLHTDAGVIGTYEFPGPDTPVTLNGEAVTPPFHVIGAMMAEGDKEMMAEGDEAMMEGDKAMAEGDEAMMAEGDEAMMEGDKAMMAAVACQEDYVVQDDDWLSRIAEKFYADVLAFPAIAQATNAHYEAAMMAEGDQAMAEGDQAMMAEGDKAMAEGDEAMMAEGDQAMMAEGALMVEGADGQMMEAMLDTEGKLMVKGADGQMMEVKLDEQGHMMAADGSMVEGKLILEGADGQMMDVMMADGKLMTKGADGQMMEVAMGDKAMAGEAMADEAMMAEGDEAMMEGDKAMMAGGYAMIENPNIIEPGWVLCIPSAADAQMLLSTETAMMAK